MGVNLLLIKCSKQNLNTKSLTEAEAFGISDFLPNATWAFMILEAQGHPIHTNVVYQYNQSAMKIELKGNYCMDKSHDILMYNISSLRIAYLQIYSGD